MAGNILVSGVTVPPFSVYRGTETIREFTPQGVRLRDFAHSWNPLAVTSDGSIVTNGELIPAGKTSGYRFPTTYDGPPLPGGNVSSTTYRPATAIHQHYQFSTVPVSYYTSRPAVIRNDLDTGVQTPFAVGYESTDITVGQDGYLYLTNYNRLAKFDPISLNKLADLPQTIASERCQIAVDASGNIIVGARLSNLPSISKYAPDGRLIATISLDNHKGTDSQLSDIVIDADGEIWVGYDSGAIARVAADFTAVLGWFDSGLQTPYLAPAGTYDTPSPPPDSTISIADSSVVEGNEISPHLAFTLTRTGDLSRRAAVAFQFTTTPSRGASVGEWSRIDSATFEIGQTSVQVYLPISPDLFPEPDETVTVTLVEPYNARIGRGTAIGTIIDDDTSLPPPPPGLSTLSVSSPVVNEGGYATFVLTLSQPSTEVFIAFTQLMPGTAGVGDYAEDRSDYDHYKLVFLPGETSKTLLVPTVGDGIPEPDETFSLAVIGTNGIGGALQNGGVGVATIRDVARASAGVSIEDGTGREGNEDPTPVTFTIRLDRPSDRPISVDYRAESLYWPIQGAPFTPVTGTATFAPGETVKTISLNLKGDRYYNYNSFLNLTITRADATILRGKATFTLENDDPIPKARIVLDQPSVAEGDDSTVYVGGRVVFSSPPVYTINTMRFKLADGTAKIGEDCLQINYDRVSFNPNDGTYTLGFWVLGDRVHEANETLSVVLLPDESSTPFYLPDPAGSVATVTIVDDDPEVNPKGIQPTRTAEAVDADLDGTYDSVRPRADQLGISRDGKSHTAALFAFDVSGVLLSETPQARLSVWVAQFVAGSGPVTVWGSRGDGTLSTADLRTDAKPLATFTPDAIGNRVLTLDRAAVAALVGDSRWLTLRLDLGAGQGHAEVFASRRLTGTSSTNSYLAYWIYTTGTPELNFDRVRQDSVADAYVVAPGSTSTELPVLSNDLLYRNGANIIIGQSGPKFGRIEPYGNQLHYTPNAGATGIDTFTYFTFNTLYNEATTPVTVSILISANNAAPTIKDASYRLQQTRTQNGKLDVSDPDGPMGPTFEVVQAPAHGSVAVMADGTFTYTAANGYSGSDFFLVRASDGFATGTPAKVSFEVVTLPPLRTQPDSYEAVANRTLNAPTSILANDQLWESTAERKREIRVIRGPGRGTLAMGEDGRFAYTPQANYTGDDSFDYWVIYRKGPFQADVSSVSTVTIRVKPANVAPVAAGESYTLKQDGSLAILGTGVLANDRDPEGKPLTATLVDRPLHGSVVLDQTGRFVYVPTKGYTGTDRFTYRASDGELSSNLATVSLNIAPVNKAPIAAADSYATALNKAIFLSGRGVLANDRDPEGKPLTATLVTGLPSSAGVLSLQKDGSFIFVPRRNAKGTFTFTYRASDGQLSSAPTTVTIRIGGVAIKRARGLAARRR